MLGIRRGHCAGQQQRKISTRVDQEKSGHQEGKPTNQEEKATRKRPCEQDVEISRRRHDDEAASRLGKLVGGLQDVTLMIVRQENVIRQLVAQQKDHEDHTETLHESMGEVTAKMEGATAEICPQPSTTCRTQPAVLTVTQTIPRRATHRGGLTNASRMEARWPL